MLLRACAVGLDAGKKSRGSSGVGWVGEWVGDEEGEAPLGGHGPIAGKLRGSPKSHIAPLWQAAPGPLVFQKVKLGTGLEGASGPQEQGGPHGCFLVGGGALLDPAPQYSFLGVPHKPPSGSSCLSSLSPSSEPRVCGGRLKWNLPRGRRHESPEGTPIS